MVLLGLIAAWLNRESTEQLKRDLTSLLLGVLSFEATIRGLGGHAAMPHVTVNPVIAAASIVSQLKSLVT